MGIIRKVRSIFPIPKDWEKDDDRKNFAIRIEQFFRELFTRSIFGIRIGSGGAVRTPDTDNTITLGNAATRTVVNNLTTTASGSVLDARQGKALGDRCKALEDKFYTLIDANTNLNNLTTPGIYGCPNATTAGTLSNNPAGNVNFSMLVMNKGSSTYVQAVFVGSVIYTRTRTSTAWGSWYKFTGTAV